MRNFREMLKASLEEKEESRPSAEFTKKPAVIVMGPEHAEREKITEQYANRLKNYGFVTLCLYRSQDIKAAWEELRNQEDVDLDKVYAMGIQRGSNEVIHLSRVENRLKAIALVSGCYTPDEVFQVKTPTIMIHSGEKNESYDSAQAVYKTIHAEEKMAIWEDAVSYTQYVEDPKIMDQTVKSVYRWFNMHAAFPQEEE